MKNFALRVYRAVLKIPLGQTRSYKWVAKEIGSAASCRAIGQVLKKNPYPLIIPCHRVIKNDGSLGGYAQGVKRKKILIDLENKLAKCLRY